MMMNPPKRMTITLDQAARLIDAIERMRYESRLDYVTRLLRLFGGEAVIAACRAAGVDQADLAVEALHKWALTAGEQLEAILQEVTQR